MVECGLPKAETRVRFPSPAPISEVKALFSSKKNKPRERFYLLPGQSGRAFRRKQKTFLKYSIIVGLIAAVLVAGLMFLLAKVSAVK